MRLRPEHIPVREQHPILGDCISSSASDSWLTSRRVMSEGREILLSGWGRRPTEEQARLWISIEGRIEKLVAKAVATIQAPPGKPWWRRFSREDLALREVHLESEGEFALFFDTPLGDKLDLWPAATFLDFELREWEWAS